MLYFLPNKESSPLSIYIVTNIESRFPATLVLWLGTQFYRSLYGNAGRMEPLTPDLSSKLGDEMWDLKSSGIFLISLLGAEIRIYPDDFMLRHGLSGRL
ncbi:hypothetical protein AVEN_35156-1 [Araneus ventricosus]|uniref:Uncharacterized protein n=1 Tax=Araneus ventricosus TaxID=182803 RepID=A0A4Y2HC40_ARAVE|nr:hypothetical protein AVEN_35156-1 [Araneus ventricosus]